MEFFRGAARDSFKIRGFATGFRGGLTMRNTRRYGGYIVHMAWS